jgi:hypothetical protein
MGNESERKHDPAENRAKEMGHRWDEVKTGGDEQNVGQTGEAGFGGQTAGSGGVIGGSTDFLSGETGEGSKGEPPDKKRGKGRGFIGSEADEESGDYLEKDGVPEEGFAEHGQGAPEGAEPGGVEGTSERTANRESDIEGSSTNR